MNYYEHHLGDWAAATGHLTWDEDMAYTRLLRAYYHAERAIPDGQQYRLAKATTPGQRRAVDSVLLEFFSLRDGHHRQKRADEEIERFQDKQRKAKASANARWSHTERNANASPNAMRTHSEGNALQTPDTIPKKPKPPSPTAKSPLCPDGVDSQVWADWLALRKAKDAPVTPTVLRGAEAEAAKAGMPLGNFLAEWCSRGSQGLKAAWLKPDERPRPTNGNHAEPAWRTEQRERNEAFAGPYAARRSTPKPSAEIIDMEAPDGTARLVG